MSISPAVRAIRLARPIFLAALSLALPAIATAQDAPDALVALSLDDAAALAVQRQPQLEALDAEARSARQRAIAAGELPDPRLSLGISDLTLEGANRFTLREESDTQIMAGIRQDFPRADKRRLQRERAEHEAQTFDAERLATERKIARETGLAWLDVWKAEESRRLARRSLAEAERQFQAMEIAYTSGRGSQAEVLAAKVEAESLRDQVAGYAQQSRHYRNGLARWIGEAAFGLICPELPPEFAPDVAALSAALLTHPHFLAEARKVATAETDVQLARQDYRPDWALTVGYGHRPEFADYAQVQVEIPLPVFTGRRQDRQLDAAQGMQASQEFRLDDALREHRSEIRMNAEDWQLLQERLSRYDTLLLPQAESRVNAALAAYGAGSGALRDVLDARRRALDIAMHKLDLQADAAKHQVQLRYFAP
jgi:outer membrane protein, heavy metal efflux system